MVNPVGSGSAARLPSSDARSQPITPTRATPVVDRSKVDPEIVRAAEGMESLFLDFMMKVMRQTVPKNEMDLESPATEIYRGMLDSQTAEKAAKAGGVGLADQMIAYLVGQGYNVNNYKINEQAAKKNPHEGTTATPETAPMKKPHPYAGKEIP